MVRIQENRLIFIAGLDPQDFFEYRMFYKISHKKLLIRLQ